MWPLSATVVAAADGCPLFAAATLLIVAAPIAAAVGRQAAPFCCGLHLLLRCQGLPLAAPLLLQLLLLLLQNLGRTIV